MVVSLLFLVGVILLNLWWFCGERTARKKAVITILHLLLVFLAVINLAVTVFISREVDSFKTESVYLAALSLDSEEERSLHAERKEDLNLWLEKAQKSYNTYGDFSFYPKEVSGFKPVA